MAAARSRLRADTDSRAKGRLRSRYDAPFAEGAVLMGAQIGQSTDVSAIANRCHLERYARKESSL
jgi:hypothetical protein